MLRKGSTLKWRKPKRVLTLTQGQGSIICEKNTPDGEGRCSSHYDLLIVIRERRRALRMYRNQNELPVPRLIKHLFGKIFADKGYVS